MQSLLTVPRGMFLHVATYTKLLSCMMNRLPYLWWLVSNGALQKSQCMLLALSIMTGTYCMISYCNHHVSTYWFTICILYCMWFNRACPETTGGHKARHVWARKDLSIRVIPLYYLMFFPVLFTMRLRVTTISSHFYLFPTCMPHESTSSWRIWTSSSGHMYTLPEMLLTTHVNLVRLHTASCTLAKCLPHVCHHDVMLTLPWQLIKYIRCLPVPVCHIWLLRSMIHTFSQYSIYISLYC